MAELLESTAAIGRASLKLKKLESIKLTQNGQISSHCVRVCLGRYRRTTATLYTPTTCCRRANTLSASWSAAASKTIDYIVRPARRFCLFSSTKLNETLGEPPAPTGAPGRPGPARAGQHANGWPRSTTESGAEPTTRQSIIWLAIDSWLASCRGVALLWRGRPVGRAFCISRCASWRADLQAHPAPESVRRIDSKGRRANTQQAPQARTPARLLQLLQLLRAHSSGSM